MRGNRVFTQGGMTIIELMIAMTVGLMVSSAALTMFISNATSYSENQKVARLQENARFSLEKLGREAREAGGVPCGDHLDVANTINGAALRWWSHWEGGFKGFESGNSSFPWSVGSSPGDRLAGTDALIIQTATVNEQIEIDAHDPNSAKFEFDNDDEKLVKGDVVMACDYTQAVMFQVSKDKPDGFVGKSAQIRELFHFELLTS